jgi:tetratricopeptide (TPR) repeat protein
MRHEFIIAGAILVFAAVLPARGQRSFAAQQDQSPESVQKAKDFYREGQRHMREGNFTAANDAFMKAELTLRSEEAAPVVLSPGTGWLSAQPQGAENAALPAKAAVDPNIYYNLGVGALQKGDFIQAEAAFRRVVELVPADKESSYNLGVLYEKYLNRPKDALKYYLRYVNLSEPEDLDVERVRAWIREINSQARE